MSLPTLPFRLTTAFVARFLALSALALTTNTSVADTPANATKPASAIVVLQQGLGGYEGTEDTFLSDYNRPPTRKANFSFGSSQTLAVYERGKGGGENTRTLIRFDLSKVRGTITAAQLVLTKAAQSPNGQAYYNQTISLYRVADANRDWQAGASRYAAEPEVAVWDRRADPAVAWNGGPGLAAEKDYFKTPLATAQSGDRIGGTASFNFADAGFLNSWAANPELNAGFLLMETDAFTNGGDAFHSSESPKQELRPRLILTVTGGLAGFTPFRPSHPPIPIRFTLTQPGYLTLAIDDGEGRRVRNLIAETLYPAGENVVWWDGLDESGRGDTSPRGYYKILGKLVNPGNYRVRGLVHPQLGLTYEFPVYNPGSPPWSAYEKTSSGWLADHSPPSEVLFQPGPEPRVLIGSYIVEGGSCLTWVDLDGRKQRGMGWLGGGNWTGASNLARDVGPNPLPGKSVFAATTWPVNKTKDNPGTVELRLIAIGEKENKPVLIHGFPGAATDPSYASLLGGLAVRDGIAWASLPSRGQLLAIDIAAGKVLRTYLVPNAHGLAFDAGGRLIVVQGDGIRRYQVPMRAAGVVAAAELPKPDALVASGLDDPQRIALDADSNIYVSQQGQSHNVKVFSATGKPLRTIGKPGVPSIGAYDQERMNHPTGVTISSDGHLWVAEADEAPRRVSVWTLQGAFVRAFYGSLQYGGGGQIDPLDKTRFYYGTLGYAMEFQLDWTKGTDKLVRVYSRPPADYERAGSPELPIHAFGRQYMSNYNNVWLMGANLARLWLMRDGRAVPVAMCGRVDSWPGFTQAQFKALLPPGDSNDPNYVNTLKRWMFVWSDRNGNEKVEPEELSVRQDAQTRRQGILPVVVQPDLSFTVGNGYRLKPTSVDKNGIPLYDMAEAVPLLPLSETDNGRWPLARYQVLELDQNWVVQPGGPISGYKNGTLMWNYPCRWPSQGAMYYDPLDEPAKPGLLVGLNRLAGPALHIAGSEVGTVWGVHANNGAVSLFSPDGLFVGSLGLDSRVGKRISGVNAVARGQSMRDLTLGEEHYMVNLCQTSDGQVYLVTAFGILHVHGLENVRRLPDQQLTVTPTLLASASSYLLSADSTPKLKKRLPPLTVRLVNGAPTWPDSSWVTVHATEKIQAAVAISGDRLYASFRTDDGKLLTTNTGGTVEGLFKTGGGLDLMLGTDANADPKRTKPVPGDVRLLVTRVNGKTAATLYKAVVPGTKNPVPFSSPWNTVTLDKVEDVSGQVELTSLIPPGKTATFTFSVPLAVLGLKPEDGQNLRGDIGILRGQSGATVQRLYWSNKATGLISDVPSEAMFTPQLWGNVQIRAEAVTAP